jgi:hypothetical protein
MLDGDRVRPSEPHAEYKKHLLKTVQRNPSVFRYQTFFKKRDLQSDSKLRPVTDTESKNNQRNKRSLLFIREIKKFAVVIHISSWGLLGCDAV